MLARLSSTGLFPFCVPFCPVIVLELVQSVGLAILGPAAFLHGAMRAGELRRT